MLITTDLLRLHDYGIRYMSSTMAIVPGILNLYFCVTMAGYRLGTEQHHAGYELKINHVVTAVFTFSTNRKYPLDSRTQFLKLLICNYNIYILNKSKGMCILLG